VFNPLFGGGIGAPSEVPPAKSKTPDARAGWLKYIQTAYNGRACIRCILHETGRIDRGRATSTPAKGADFCNEYRPKYRSFDF
jgi:hypothetical protein